MTKVSYVDRLRYIMLSVQDLASLQTDILAWLDELLQILLSKTICET